MSIAVNYTEPIGIFGFIVDEEILCLACDHDAVWICLLQAVIYLN